ncbi:hypothetical protein [Weissella hellenica]|uniref:Uncharacterized protein n=1 Tax=Weissella hellenica TaxID=46256 RepID=A0A4Y4G0P1_WEIHE|nr:hypothetical protein [Weissella hellenica]NKY66782.1 hypothetical protein [Weissella hellenica]GED35952.1 hypothetical protein WHE01_08560 [Weissella hellenica]SCB85739.1 hypothetical protein GA0061075_10452 [Weissella hellenica]
MLERNWDRKLLLISAVWQFIDGALTIGLVGTLFILAGLVNLLLAKYFLKEKEINKWVLPILIIEVIIAYFCMDIVTVALLVPTTIIISLKRKKQKLVNS